MSETQPDSPAEGLPSAEAIKASLGAVREQIAAAVSDLARQQAKVATLKEEEKLWERLLALRQGGQQSSHAVRAEQVPAAVEMSPGRAAVAVVHHELEKAHRPLHISELMRLLADQGVSLPGAGAQANLITYLRRDERFVRPARGMYALTEWGIAAEAPPPVRRRRRRVRSGKRT